MADLTKQVRALREKPGTILHLIMMSPGTTHRELCDMTGYYDSQVQGTLVWLINEGLVLRVYGEHPPCTYHATNKAHDNYGTDEHDEDEETDT